MSILTIPRRRPSRPLARLVGLTAAVALTLFAGGLSRPASSIPVKICGFCTVPASQSCSGQQLVASGCCFGGQTPACLEQLDITGNCVSAVTVFCH